MKIGYARVSRTDQKLELQTDALKAAGVEQIFSDKISGSRSDREGLDSLLSVARAGDCIVVWRLDRLARSLKHLIELTAEFEKRGIQLASITEGFDTTKPAGKMVFHIFGAIAEFERNLIKERTRAGLDAAKARGRVGGRKRVITAEKEKTLRMLLESSRDFRSHAIVLGISERTVRRFAAGQYI
ncbi:MAG: recombinase family protein [Pyrinomonadaceae bacterium]